MDANYVCLKENTTQITRTTKFRRSRHWIGAMSRNRVGTNEGFVRPVARSSNARSIGFRVDAARPEVRSVRGVQ
jgi:hypothetical protein